MHPEKARDNDYDDDHTDDIEDVHSFSPIARKEAGCSLRRIHDCYLMPFFLSSTPGKYLSYDVGFIPVRRFRGW